MTQIHSRRTTHTFFIGLFVLIGTALLIATIIWLGASQFFKEQALYCTYFTGSVEGLETGSAVKYLGVPCGTIKKLNVAPDGKLIEIIMQIDQKIEINDSLRIKSELSGLAGGRFLQLFYPASSDFANLYPQINFKPPFKLIKSAPSGIEEIEIAARDVLNKMLQLNVKGISEGTLQFLNSTTKFFESENLQQILVNIENSSAKLDNILAKAEGSEIINNFELTSSNFLKTSMELKKFTDTLNFQLQNLNLHGYANKVFLSCDSTMVTARNTINNVGWRTDNMMFNLAETLDELRLTNKQLRKSLRAISDHPSQIFLSEPPLKDK